MKNNLKFFGIVAAVAIIGFSVTGCPTSGSDSGDPDCAFIGPTLNLSGQVWEFGWDCDTCDYEGQDWDCDSCERILMHFTEDRNISAVRCEEGYRIVTGITETGTIIGGQLSLTIGSPNSLDPIENLSFFGVAYEVWPDFHISNTNARGVSFGSLAIPNGLLRRGYLTGRGEYVVVYVYVDQDVTIAGTGGEVLFACECEDRDGECYCVYFGDACDCDGIGNTGSFNISLRAGWNALLIHNDWDDATSTGTFILSAGEGPTKWLLWEEHNSHSGTLDRSSRASSGVPSFRSRR